MNLKILRDNQRLTGLGIEKDKTYEIDEYQPIVWDEWKVKVIMKQKGKFRYALVNDEDGELVD